jgi:hypothetical protein
MIMRFHYHIHRYGIAIACVLLADMAGPARAQSALLTLAQSAVHTGSFRQVEIRGRVVRLSTAGNGDVNAIILASGAEYALSSDGTVDGLVLIPGARIVLPPLAGAMSLAGIAVGDHIIVRGAPDAAGLAVIAERVSDDTTGAALTVVVQADTAPTTPARLALR